jgi:16S rRNA (guanine527-N7)-methyltransferase
MKNHPRPRPGQHRRPEIIYPIPEANDRLWDLFRHHGLADFPHDKREMLARFYHLLMNHQLTDNVTRITKFRDIAIKHFIDSLIVAQITKLQFPLLDVGTGAGFPGIPLKILFPTEKIILAEGVRRRVDFLRAVREELKLENLDLIGRKVDPTFVYPVRGVITRALSDISQTLYDISQCLEVGGFVYLMKGPGVDAELVEAKAKWSEYFQLENDIPYELPKTPHQRRLVIFSKIKTPKVEAVK